MSESIPFQGRLQVKTMLVKKIMYLMGLLLAVVGSTTCSRILGLVPTPSLSHQQSLAIVMQALHAQGHDVTVLTTSPLKENKDNYTEIDMSFLYELWNEVDVASMADWDHLEIFKVLMPFCSKLCERAMKSPLIRELRESKQKFDLVVLEKLPYFCMYGLIHELGSPPVVGFLSFGIHPAAHWTMANPCNPSYCPDINLPYSDHMSLRQIAYNTYASLRMLYMWFIDGLAEQTHQLKKYFDVEPNYFYELDYNFSLLIVNNHWITDYPLPTAPNVVQATGFHVEKKREPLPQDLEHFMDSASYGIIYFSLGTNIICSELSEELIQVFVTAFSELPYKILWKWELNTLPGKPDNVMIKKWFPQQDILAHPNVKLFITQGGLLSVCESAYFSVPMLCIPFIGDQFHHAIKIESTGIGTMMRLAMLTESNLLSNISALIDDKRYVTKMAEFSDIYKEQADASLPRIVWWLEYILRYGGSQHLHSAALQLSWHQTVLLDLVATLVMVTFLSILLLRCFIIRVHATSSDKA